VVVPLATGSLEMLASGVCGVRWVGRRDSLLVKSAFSTS